METLREDKEVQQLKEQYKVKFGENAPPYCLDTDINVECYKGRLKKLINID